MFSRERNHQLISIFQRKKSCIIWVDKNCIILTRIRRQNGDYFIFITGVGPQRPLFNIKIALLPVDQSPRQFKTLSGWEYGRSGTTVKC